MRKRPEDGIVYVEPALCVGCKSCIAACPWGAPQWNPETGKVVKCDYCMDRVDQGWIGLRDQMRHHCLSFGRVEQMDTTKLERFAKTVAFELETVVNAR
jgi:Fe-S-cluster-containing dehydrogenase component